MRQFTSRGETASGGTATCIFGGGGCARRKACKAGLKFGSDDVGAPQIILLSGSPTGVVALIGWLASTGIATMSTWSLS
jgi:hypothetical protein